MCLKCAMRAAAEGDEEAAVTLEALTDPVFAAGVSMMVGELMNRFNLDEFAMDSDKFDHDSMPGIAFARPKDNILIARRVKRSDIPAEVAYARRGAQQVN